MVNKASCVIRLDLAIFPVLFFVDKVLICDG